MKIEARAKVNLYLKILGKREDGFHELETLMAPLSLKDEIEIEEMDHDIIIQVEGMDLSCGTDNLAYRAAQGVRERAGISKGVRILLKKKIPMGGGLAGGSSNCAAVLRGVNELWQAGLSDAVLHEIAADLGSDINFFLQDGPAVCRGRGEIIEPVTLKEDLWIMLVNPGFGVETPWAYKAYAQNPQQADECKMMLHMRKRNSKTWEEFTLRNDLEMPVLAKYLWIAEAKQWLAKQEGVSAAMMSGSGATVFALCHQESAVDNLLEASLEFFGSTAWIEKVKVIGS
ncbi:MAG: 4-(cytidine 5'-diphospho)-2-C-methyl-D-erythritol kinase [Verrucomicrobiota bacterium]